MVYFCNESGSRVFRRFETSIIPRIGEIVSIELENEMYRKSFTVCDVEHRIINRHDILIFLKEE